MARSSRLKTRGKISSSRRRSVLSIRGIPSGPGESAAVHHAQSSLLDVGDGVEMSDDDPAVGSTAETLTVTGSDAPVQAQEEGNPVRGRDTIPMIADDAPADSDVLWISGGGDAGRGGVERRSLLQVTFTHQTVRNRL